jgi:integrase
MPAQILREILADYAAVTGLSADTKRLHVVWLTHLERFLAREPLLSDFNDLTYARFVEWRRQKVRPETLRGDCCKLLALWRWCSGGKRRWIDPPEVKAPPPTHALPRALDREQLERLWEVAASYPRLVGTLPGHVYMTALLYVLWDTSERVGAVHQIERDLIDLKGGWISISPACRKGGLQGRLYKIRPQTVRALERLLGIYDGERPFAECSLNNIYKHWPYLRTAAALPRWATPHTIRKSHASHLVASGGDARASLGHSSDVITNRHYIDSRIAGKGPQPCDLLFDPGRRHWWQRWG